MNWDAIGAIGEVLGATAVVVTIIYFSLQLRKTQAAVETASLQTNQQGVMELQKIDLEFADILVKANSGESLTEIETHRINSIAGARISFAHNLYQRSVLLGQNEDAAVRGFATYLSINPGLRPYWDTFPGYTIADDWISLVNKELKKMASNT